MNATITTTQTREVVLDGYVYLQVGNQFFAGCRRCGGTGHYSFNGVHDLCYECNNDPSAKLGTHIGTAEEATRHANRRAKAKARRDAKREQEAQARMQAMADAQDAVPADVREFLQFAYDNGDRSDFVRSMASRMYTYNDMVKYGGFSEKMLAAIRRVMQDRAEQEQVKSELGPVAEGRLALTGVVQSTKTYNGDYGISFKMLVVLPSGHKVFGTIPTSILEARTLEELTGAQVEFTATVEQSRNDETFGIFKRPAKARVA